VDARVADATHDADADVDVDAGFADAAPGDAAPADAGPEGAWRTVHQAPSTDTLQRLSVSTNARGDGAIAWERFPGVLQAVVYSEATQSWGPVTTFPRPEYYRGSPMVRVLPDGAVLMVYVETAISGASRELRAIEVLGGVLGVLIGLAQVGFLLWHGQAA
jgi:hypothetical protein